MTGSVNKAIIIGHLGRDPEVRYLPNGDAVSNFSVATTERWKDKASQEQKEATEWHRVSVFGKLAEIAGEYLKKGSMVYVEGRLQTRKWKDKQDVERYTTEIRADTIRFLNRVEGGDEESTPAAKPASEGKKPASKPKPGPSILSDMDDDIPF